MDLPFRSLLRWASARLFANAGMGTFAPIDQIEKAAYDNQFDVNVKGVFFTVQKLAGLLG